MKRNSSVPSIATSHGTQPQSENSSHRGGGGLRKLPTNPNVRMSYDQGAGLHDIVEEEAKQITGGAGASRGMNIK